MKKNNRYQLRGCKKKLKARKFTLYIMYGMAGFISIALLSITALVFIRTKEATKLHALWANINSYESQLITFKQKYAQLPGDFSNAQTIWPITKNGNGDGKISYESLNNREDLRAWQQLSLAQLIKGTYSGTVEDPVYKIGTNIPTSNFKDGGFWLGHFKTQGQYGLYIQFARFTNDVTEGGIISPISAEDIDIKGDDGKPMTGRIISENGHQEILCTNHSTQSYKEVSHPACRIWFFSNM